MLQVNPAELMTKVTEAKKEYVSIVRQAEAIKEAEKVSLHNYTFFSYILRQEKIVDADHMTPDGS